MFRSLTRVHFASFGIIMLAIMLGGALLVVLVPLMFAIAVSVVAVALIGALALTLWRLFRPKLDPFEYKGKIEIKNHG